MKDTPVVTERKVYARQSDESAVRETEYLCSIPGMRDSLMEGLNTPIAECYKTVQ